MKDNRPAAPVIDDELAEMEAHAHVSSVRKVIDSVMRQVKATPTNRAPNEKSHRDKRNSPSAQGRTVRRAMLRQGQTPDPKTRPHARLGRAKMVKSQPQLVIEYRAAVRGELSRIKLTRLQGECPEIKYLLGTPGLKNVWQLSQAPTAWIQAIPGLGPARRKKIRGYLVGKGIQVIWEA